MWKWTAHLSSAHCIVLTHMHSRRVCQKLVREMTLVLLPQVLALAVQQRPLVSIVCHGFVYMMAHLSNTFNVHLFSAPATTSTTTTQTTSPETTSEFLFLIYTFIYIYIFDMYQALSETQAQLFL